MKNFKNKIALITGGGSGIGKIMARLLLEKNTTVIIWDVNQTNIDTTLKELKQKGEIFAYNVDVANVDQVKEAALKVKREVGVVDLLINNAGIIVGKYFHEHKISDINKTMMINANAPMYVTSVFIQDMLIQNAGHICNIASSAGIVSNPKMSVYVASKWAIVGWSDSLRLEMDQLGKNIKVTTILPYYINTGMFDGVKSKIKILEPEKTALKIIQAIEKDIKMMTIPGYIYRFSRLGQAILPKKVYDWFSGDVLGIYKTMEDFTGRKK